jgi:hypothetical protein
LSGIEKRTVIGDSCKMLSLSYVLRRSLKKNNNLYSAMVKVPSCAGFQGRTPIPKSKSVAAEEVSTVIILMITNQPCATCNSQ